MNPTDVSRQRLNKWLYIGVVLLVCTSVAVGLFVFKPAWEERSAAAGQTSEPTAEDVPEQTYGDVLSAATAVAEGFVNVDYRKFEESVERVAAGATGEFAEQYKASTEGLRTLMTENKSVMTSKVLASGVVTISEFTARVLVTTSGTVTNTSTEGTEYAREMRLQLDLSKIQDKWLVNDVQFVG